MARRSRFERAKKAGANKFGRFQRHRKHALESLEQRLALATFSPTLFSDGTLPANTLRAAITSASTNGQPDTIKLKAGTYTLSLGAAGVLENSNATGDLDVKAADGKTITIQGVGANATFIDANELDRVFHVHPNVTLILSKLTIRDGKAYDNGTSVATEARGGGILIDRAKVTLDQVMIVSCFAQAADRLDAPAGEDGEDGLAAVGGGIYASLNANQTLTIKNSTIVSNVTFGGDAGNGGDTVDDDAGIGGNGGEAKGGGVYVTGGALVVTGSAINSNQALSGAGGSGGFGDEPGIGGSGGQAEGGGILAESTAVSISNSTIATNIIFASVGGNSGRDSSLNGTTPGSGGDAFGAGLFIESGSLQFASSNIRNNEARGGQGGVPAGLTGITGGSGGQGVAGGIYLQLVALPTIAATTIAGNKATGGNGGQGSGAGTGGVGAAGGIYTFGSAAHLLTIKDSTISANTATGGEGAVGQESILGSAGGDGGTGGGADGGGLYAKSPVVVTNSTISRNTALGGNGGMGGDGGNRDGGNGGDGAESRGGAVFVASTATLINSTVSGNILQGGSGGNGGNGGDDDEGGDGGDGSAGIGPGVFVDFPATLDLRNSTLVDSQGLVSVPGLGGNAAIDGAIGQIVRGIEFDLLNEGGSANAISTIIGLFNGPLVANFCLVKVDFAYQGTFAPGSADNLVVPNLLLGPLQNNGGPTETHAPLLGSPAIDTGINPNALAYDQRGTGFFRQEGPEVDIGAVEVQLPANPDLVYDPLTQQVALVVGGSDAKDKVSIVTASSGTLLKVTVNGKTTTFDTADVEKIVLLGQGGDDELSIPSTLRIPAVIYGGAGNDTLKGGAANDIILGEAGDDKLYGYGGLDLLFGGDGKDNAYGGAGDDLLIGGRTIYDGNLDALRDIQAKWNSGDSYEIRRLALLNGTGVPKLSDAEITDNAVDKLYGEAGNDLFYSRVTSGESTDRTGIEKVNLVLT